MTTAKCMDGKQLIQGPAGQLELLLSYPDGNSPDGSPVVIISHPHPLYGGTLTNKVVHILAKGVGDLGLASVRYNFRGVGDSEGQFDDGRGETEDLLAVAAWVRAQHPGSPIWLAGFSFGAYITINAYQQANAERLILVAPPTTLYDISGVTGLSVPCAILQGGQDEVIDPLAVTRWVEGLDPRPDYHWIESAGHFFHGQLNVVRDFVKQVWA